MSTVPHHSSHHHHPLPPSQLHHPQSHHVPSIQQHHQQQHPTPAHHSSQNHHQHHHNYSIIDKMNGENEGLWLQIGKLAELMTDTDKALFSYENVLRHNHFNVKALTQIANIYRTKDQFTKAVEYYHRALNVENSNIEIWGALGHCFLMMDDLQKAYAAYHQALYNSKLQKQKQDPNLWYGIGILYERYGSLDNAEEAFTSVLKMDPHFEKSNEIYFRLGIIYKQQNKFESALECFGFILQHPPAPLTEADIWFQIGHVYELKKDVNQAKRSYEKVLKFNPNHAKVLQQLGWLYFTNSNTTDQETAITYLRKSIEADANDGQSWYLLGRCFMLQQKYRLAYDAYQQAVFRDGRNPTFWCSIGVLYYQINQYRDALDAYSRAIRLNPYLSEVWYDLGTLYESCHQIPDALDAYQRAAELEPQNKFITQRLQLLKQQSGKDVPTGSKDKTGGHIAPIHQDRFAGGNTQQTPPPMPIQPKATAPVAPTFNELTKQFQKKPTDAAPPSMSAPPQNQAPPAPPAPSSYGNQQMPPQPPSYPPHHMMQQQQQQQLQYIQQQQQQGTPHHTRHEVLNKPVAQAPQTPQSSLYPSYPLQQQSPYPPPHYMKAPQPMTPQHQMPPMSQQPSQESAFHNIHRPSPLPPSANNPVLPNFTTYPPSNTAMPTPQQPSPMPNAPQNSGSLPPTPIELKRPRDFPEDERPAKRIKTDTKLENEDEEDGETMVINEDAAADPKNVPRKNSHLRDILNLTSSQDDSSVQKTETPEKENPPTAPQQQ